MAPTDSYISNIASNASTALFESRKQLQLTSTSTAKDLKLRKATGEFEGQLLSALWKSMKSTFAAPDADSDDPAHDSLEDFGMEAMCGAVGKAGGVGLGKLILKHLEPLLALSPDSDRPNSTKVSSSPADKAL
jgi:Rod binding domain-containing protein